MTQTSIQEHNQITKLKQGTLVKHKSEGFILMVTNTQRESNTFAGVMMYNNKNTDINIGIYIVGPGMGDFFVKTNRKSTRVYPLFDPFINYNTIKEWEVLKIYDNNINSTN